VGNGIFGLGQNTLRERERQFSELDNKVVRSVKGRSNTKGEQNTKIVVDVANKKRNTRPCFEVGYVPSVVPLAGEIFGSQAHRTTNCSITLS
jgi:hypothetical protein